MSTLRTKQRPKLTLQAERERRNWSRLEVAYLVACSESYITKLENGSRRGSSSVKTRLSRLFDVPADRLLRPAEDTEQVPA